VEFYGIARSLNPRAIPLPKEIKRKLNVSYGGAEDPANDTDRTAVARNTQFEFWVASWLTAGEKPIRMAEPDLQFAYRFQWRGLAAKRVRSSRQILKRVKRAADQVKKNTGTGFIALALDNYSTVRKIRSQSDLSVGARFFASDPQIEEAANYLMAEERHIKALLCFGHHARWLLEEEPPSLQMSNMTKIYLFPSSETRAQPGSRGRWLACHRPARAQ
jgi:hypothetical protein